MIIAIIDCKEKHEANILMDRFAKKGKNVFISKGRGIYGASFRPRETVTVYRVFVDYNNDDYSNSIEEDVAGFRKAYAEILEATELKLSGEYVFMPVTYDVVLPKTI